MELPAFGILCALCAAAFSAGARHPGHLLHWLSGLVLLLAACAPYTPWARAGIVLTVEPQQFAGALALACAFLLKSPWRSAVAAFLGGAAAALWSLVLAAQGLPPAMTTPFAALLAAAALLCAIQRPGFAAPRHREEALVIALILAVAVALVPGVVGGWQMAVGLVAVDGAAADAAASGPSALVVAALFIILGCLYASWKHR